MCRFNNTYNTLKQSCVAGPFSACSGSRPVKAFRHRLQLSAQHFSPLASKSVKSTLENSQRLRQCSVKSINLINCVLQCINEVLSTDVPMPGFCYSPLALFLIKDKDLAITIIFIS